MDWELKKSPRFYRSPFLGKHKITEEIRARMIDWMIEVLSSFNCTTNTFFVSVDILDNYLARSNKIFETKNIHLIGVTSMLIASKMEEIIPFKISTVVEKMTHDKMSRKKIVKCEESILEAFNYNMLAPNSLFVFIELVIVKAGLFESGYY